MNIKSLEYVKVTEIKRKNVDYSFLPEVWFTFSILISLIPKISMQKFANNANGIANGFELLIVFSYIANFSTHNKVSFISMNLFLSSNKNKSHLGILRLIVVADKVGLNQLN